MSGGGRGVCLIIIFNHPFLKNIPLLRAIYGSRFSQIRFLMPFERSDDPDVLTVYRGSFSHCAYAVEHLPALQATGASHFIFVHDDVLLSPWLDETNILSFFGCTGPRDGYIGDIRDVYENVTDWSFQLGSAWRLLHPRNHASGTGVESFHTVLRYLPPHDEAARRAAAYGIPPTTRWRVTADVFDGAVKPQYRFFGRERDSDADFVRSLADGVFGASDAVLEIPYPIAISGPHTDLYIVPGEGLATFAHIAATLATAGLFVEMAAPTALMLACDRIATAKDLGIDSRWHEHLISPYLALYQMYCDRALVSVHPVKLSLVADTDAFLDYCDPSQSYGDALVAGDFKAVIAARFPDFEPDRYLAMHEDVQLANTSAFEHFFLFGQSEGRRWKPELAASL